MKQIYIVFLLMSAHAVSRAQVLLNVAPGTDLNIAAGSVFSAGGLSLTPTTSFTLNGVELNQNSTVANIAFAPHISRVFRFSANTNPFNGSIQFFYNDGLLNGVLEPDLQINIHNGSSWNNYVTSGFDLFNNYVISNSIAATPLNEITLASVFAVLPLSWGQVDAQRKADGIAVRWETIQEQQVAWFGVERSFDGASWKTIEDKIPARSLGSRQQYNYKDSTGYTSQLFYRIKQTGADGRSSWSQVASVNSISQAGKLTVYPNPVQHQVYLDNRTGSAISNVQLYNNQGALIKTWFSAQASYQLGQYAPGIYYLNVTFTDGSKKQFTINRQ